MHMNCQLDDRPKIKVPKRFNVWVSTRWSTAGCCRWIRAMASWRQSKKKKLWHRSGFRIIWSAGGGSGLQHHCTFAPPEANGKCVYCNHCEPYPAGLDIGTINKFYDLAKIGDDMVQQHYLALSKNASDCIVCGHCNSRCPFFVDQMTRMQEIAAYFGK